MNTQMVKKYHISDGTLVLAIRISEAGSYLVTAPMWPGFSTEAKAINEIFPKARRGIKLLQRKWAREAAAKISQR